MRWLLAMSFVVGCSEVESFTPADVASDDSVSDLGDSARDSSDAWVEVASDSGPTPTGIIDTSDATGWKWTLTATAGIRDPFVTFVPSGNEILGASKEHLIRSSATGWAAVDATLLYGNYLPRDVAAWVDDRSITRASGGGFLFVSDGVLHRAAPGKDFVAEGAVPGNCFRVVETDGGVSFALDANGDFYRREKGSSVWTVDAFAEKAHLDVFGGERVLVSSEAGIRISYDGGATYEKAISYGGSSAGDDALSSKGVLAPYGGVYGGVRLYEPASGTWKDVLLDFEVESPIVARGDRVFVSGYPKNDTSKPRLARSLDGGATWTLIPRAALIDRLEIGDGKRLLGSQPVYTSGGVVRTPVISDDDGDTFSELPARPTFGDVSSFVEQEKDKIWMRSNAQTLRSIDGAKTFATITSPRWFSSGPEGTMPEVFPEGALGVEPTSHTIFLTAGWLAPVYRRNEATSSWESISVGGPFAATAGKIAVGGRLSTDLGKTMGKYAEGFSVAYGQGFDASGRLVVALPVESWKGPTSPLFATTDGETWTPLGALPDGVHHLVVAANGTLFSDFDGLQSSTDGVVWTKVLSDVVRDVTTVLPTGAIVTVIKKPLPTGAQHFEVLVSNDNGKTFHVRTGDLSHIPAGFGVVGGTIWANLRERGLYALSP